MLTDAEYSFTPVPGSNYRLPNSGFTTIDTAITVNSLSDMTGSGLIVGDGSIEITGGVALLSDSVILIPLSFGSRQGHIMGNARIYAPISGTGGLTLSGGDISLGEANSFTGPLVINGGFIRFNDLSAFGPDSSQITIYNAGFEQEGGGTLVFDRPLRLGGGVIGFQGSSGSVFQFTAPITGPGGLSLQFSNSMSITGVNGYTGPTTIHTDLTINGDAAFGQSSQIFLESGSLKVTGPWTTSKPLQTTIGFFALDTNGFDISLLGPLSSQNSFPLTKRGLGRLTIANGAEFIGTLMVNEGTLDLRGPLAGSITAIAGTTVTGDGSVSGDLSIDGTLDPSVGAGEISAGTLQLETGATLHILLDSGTLFDRVVSLNAPSLGSNVTLDLQLAPGFDPIDDFDEFILIRNDSGSPISKSVPAPLVFAGNALDEGEVFYAGGQAWLFSYTGGSGNDVTIHAVPEPSIIATVVAGLAVLGFRRRHADR